MSEDTVVTEIVLSTGAVVFRKGDRTSLIAMLLGPDPLTYIPSELYAPEALRREGDQAWTPAAVRAETIVLVGGERTIASFGTSLDGGVVNVGG